MDEKNLSERDICTKFITPASRLAGWDEMSQIREEVTFAKGHGASTGLRSGVKVRTCAVSSRALMLSQFLLSR